MVCVGWLLQVVLMYTVTVPTVPYAPQLYEPYYVFQATFNENGDNSEQKVEKKSNEQLWHV